MKLIALAQFLIIPSLAVAQAPSPGGPGSGLSTLAQELRGVWRGVAVEATGGRGQVSYELASELGPMGANLRIFTLRHYSFQGLSVLTRPDLPDSNPTVADLIATWMPFGANAGTYDLRGDTVVMTPTIAKNPRTMTGTFQAKWTARIVADTLWLRNTRGGRLDRWVRTER